MTLLSMSYQKVIFLPNQIYQDFIISNWIIYSKNEYNEIVLMKYYSTETLSRKTNNQNVFFNRFSFLHYLQKMKKIWKP